MRNTSGPERGNWATYARTARETAGISKAEIARRLRVDRGTVHRWETGQTRPEDANVVQAFASLFALDLDEALSAAGMRPGERVDAPLPVDEELELVRTDPKLSNRMKARIITIIMERRERQRAESLAETRRLIELMREREAG